MIPFYASYEEETRGTPPFDPALLVCLLLYAYCVGVFSSRKIAQACERNLAFLAIVGDDRPDFRTISDFRKIHLGGLRRPVHRRCCAWPRRPAWCGWATWPSTAPSSRAMPRGTRP